MTAATSLSPPRIWQSYSLELRCWPDGFIVFNKISGHTHLLNSKAGRIVQLLAQKPATAAELSKTIASEADLDGDPELVQHVEKLLSELDHLGLIEPVNP